MNGEAIKTRKIFAGSILVLLFLSPVFVSAEQDPDTVGKTGITYECTKGECTYEDVLAAADKLLTFGRNIALEFSVVIIAIAGFKYMISGDNPGERKKANQMFVHVGWGIFFVLGGWLIVHLITTALLTPDALSGIPTGLR